MSAITQSQAMDLEQRLNTLERRVGMERLRTSINNRIDNNRIDSYDSVDDRLAKLRSDLQGKLTKAASEGGNAGTDSTAATRRNNSNSNSGGGSNNNNSNSNTRANDESWKAIQRLLRELDPGIALTHQQQPLLYKRQQVLACSDELAHDFGHLDAVLKLLLSGTKADGAAHGLVEEDGGGGNENNHHHQATSQTTGKQQQQQQQKQQKQKQVQGKKETELHQKLKQQLQQNQQQETTSTNNNNNINNNNNNSTLRLDQVTQSPILASPHYHRGGAANGVSSSEQKRVSDLTHRLLDLNERTKTLQSNLRTYLECYHVSTMAVSEKMILADETIAGKTTSSGSN